MPQIDPVQVKARLDERIRQIEERREAIRRDDEGMRDELADYDQHPGDEGRYGVCVDCGKEIPPERLEAAPESIRCVDDQRRFEALLRQRGGDASR